MPDHPICGVCMHIIDEEGCLCRKKEQVMDRDTALRFFPECDTCGKILYEGEDCGCPPKTEDTAMDEIWIITYFVAQDNTWMMKAVSGRDACRAEMGRLSTQFPAIQFVSALMQPHDPVPV